MSGFNSRPGQPLTDGERQVLEMVAIGHTNESIAAALYVSLEAIRSRVKCILRKLSAVNRAHAVHLAWQQGLLK